MLNKQIKLVFALLLIAIPISYSSEFNISLEKGWNLVSIPFLLSNTSVSHVLSSISGNYENVISYDNGKYLFYNPNFPYSNLKNIDNKMGFWIYMKNKDTLSVKGKLSESVTIVLRRGWNLIGMPYKKEINVSDFLGSAKNRVRRIVSYENGTFRLYSPLRQHNTLSKLKQGRGYWISMRLGYMLAIDNNDTSIEAVIISPDESAGAGIQVYPAANRNKTVHVSVLVGHRDSIDNVTAQTPKGEIILNKANDVDSDTANYTGSFEMNYSDAAGTYDIRAAAVDEYGFSDARTGSFEYMELAALVLDSSLINFNNVQPGGASYVDGDLSLLTPDKPTVKNAGNVAIDVMIGGTNLTGPGDIDAGNVAYKFGSSAFNALNSTDERVDLNLLGRVNADFRLGVDAA
ncbi:hypothetical protein GF323_01300, partial [Candidatus Woesearchaeota archaeon]|nr:hypothetical protein [Candidatus Woesearchaeota archaeon]